MLANHTPNFKQKSLIIFDWDGTLMDSIGLIVESMQHAADKHGLTVSDEATRGIIGLSMQTAVATLFADVPERHADLVQDYGAYYVQHCHDDTLFAGIATLLNDLHAQGKTLAVATGKKRQGLARVLPQTGVEALFSVTRCADEAAGKPDPRMLHQILQATGKTVSDAVMVGDSVHDLRMAHAIGMDSIAVTYGCATADVLADEQPSAMVDSVTALAALLV